MSKQYIDALVILEPGAPESALDGLRHFARVEQAARPRVVLIKADEDRIHDVEELPGVSGVFMDHVPVDERAGLGSTEQLFIDAWEHRRQPKGVRPGEGLAWDHPGFLPPDSPLQRK